MRGCECAHSAMLRVGARGVALAGRLLRRAAPTGVVGSKGPGAPTHCCAHQRRADAARWSHAAQAQVGNTGDGVVGGQAARRGAACWALPSGSLRAASSAATAEQGVVDDTAPVAAPLIDLPTSDESESLLRIRHTVRAAPLAATHLLALACALCAGGHAF